MCYYQRGDRHAAGQYVKTVRMQKEPELLGNHLSDSQADRAKIESGRESFVRGFRDVMPGAGPFTEREDLILRVS